MNRTILIALLLLTACDNQPSTSTDRPLSFPVSPVGCIQHLDKDNKVVSQSGPICDPKDLGRAR